MNFLHDENLNPKLSADGVDIVPLVRCIARPLILWTPNWLTIEFDIISEKFSIKPNGTFSWSQNLVIVTNQIGMSFKNYPLDVQQFTLTLGEFSLTTTYLIYTATASAIGYVNDPASGSKQSRNVDYNELWTYQGATGYAYLVTNPATATSKASTYSFITFTLKFSRVSFQALYYD